MTTLLYQSLMLLFVTRLFWCESSSRSFFNNLLICSHMSSQERFADLVGIFLLSNSNRANTPIVLKSIHIWTRLSYPILVKIWDKLAQNHSTVKPGRFLSHMLSNVKEVLVMSFVDIQSVPFSLRYAFPGNLVSALTLMIKVKWEVSTSSIKRNCAHASRRHPTIPLHINLSTQL